MNQEATQKRSNAGCPDFCGGRAALVRRVFNFSIESQKFLKFCALWLSCLILIGFCSSVYAQNNEEVVRVETNLIPFEVSVTDKKGDPVRGLEAKDFKVFENGAERPIEFFEPLRKSDESRPLSVVFALDVSGSVTSAELVRIHEALQDFVRKLADYNSYFAIMTFGMQVKTIQSFTNRPEKLEKSIDKILREQDGLSTHSYDAVDDAIRLIKKKSPPTVNQKIPKRAIILITDGFPVGDTVSPKTVIERANQAETTVYSVLLPSFSRLQMDKKPLLTPLEASGLLDKTGGRAFYATQKNFEPLFKSLAEEITSSYVLAFYPKDEDRRDGKFHEVRIEVSKGLQIKQNRSGYEAEQ